MINCKTCKYFTPCIKCTEGDLCPIDSTTGCCYLLLSCFDENCAYYKKEGKINES